MILLIEPRPKRDTPRSRVLAVAYANLLSFLQYDLRIYAQLKRQGFHHATFTILLLDKSIDCLKAFQQRPFRFRSRIIEQFRGRQQFDYPFPGR